MNKNKAQIARRLPGSRPARAPKRKPRPPCRGEASGFRVPGSVSRESRLDLPPRIEGLPALWRKALARAPDPGPGAFQSGRKSRSQSDPLEGPAGARTGTKSQGKDSNIQQSLARPGR